MKKQKDVTYDDVRKADLNVISGTRRVVGVTVIIVFGSISAATNGLL